MYCQLYSHVKNNYFFKQFLLMQINQQPLQQAAQNGQLEIHALLPSFHNKNKQ